MSDFNSHHHSDKPILVVFAEDFSDVITEGSKEISRKWNKMSIEYPMCGKGGENKMESEIIELSPDQIVDLPAGTELDQLVAEKVMGWNRFIYPFLFWTDADRVMRDQIPVYSTNISAAWEIVKKLASGNWTMHLEWKGADRNYANTAEVGFSSLKEPYLAHSTADTAPLAICRAALKAMEEK